MSEQLYELVRKIRFDATAIQAKVTDVLNLLNDLQLPDESQVRCEACGVKFRGPRSLADHAYTAHDGPLPEHEVALESKIAAFDAEFVPNCDTEGS